MTTALLILYGIWLIWIAVRIRRMHRADRRQTMRRVAFDRRLARKERRTQPGNTNHCEWRNIKP